MVEIYGGSCDLIVSCCAFVERNTAVEPARNLAADKKSASREEL